MNKEKIIRLSPGERIIAVVPESCAGPGWSNAPTWVYIATNDGKLREECIQPGERSIQLNVLFSVGLNVCSALINSVSTKLVKEVK